jgi:hypothetical protein
LVSAAEFETRAPPRFRERHAASNEFLDLLLEMKSQLVVEFVLNSLAPKQCTQPNQEVTEHRAPLAVSLIDHS